MLDSLIMASHCHFVPFFQYPSRHDCPSTKIICGARSRNIPVAREGRSVNDAKGKNANNTHPCPPFQEVQGNTVMHFAAALGTLPLYCCCEQASPPFGSFKLTGCSIFYAIKNCDRKGMVLPYHCEIKARRPPCCMCLAKH